MKRLEHLLAIIAEEGAEVSQSATKALRFGLATVQPGQEDTNLLRLFFEMSDLTATLRMLCEEIGIENPMIRLAWEERELKKIDKINKFLKSSKDYGTLDD